MLLAGFVFLAAAAVLVHGAYWSGRRDAAQAAIDAFTYPSASGTAMTVPDNLFERIDEIGGIERPKVTKKD